MARLDARCNLRIPVTLVIDHRDQDQYQSHSYQAITANIGLRGAFINSNFSLPEEGAVKVLAELPTTRHEIDAMVLRREKHGVALKFHDLYPEAKADLWECIRESLREGTLCPFCGEGNVRDAVCHQCGFNMEFSTRDYLQAHEDRRRSHWMEILDAATGILNEKLSRLDREFTGGLDEEAGLARLRDALNDFFGVAKEIDDLLAADPDLLKRTRTTFRERSGPVFAKSYFVNHARTWPLGYPGDYKMLENVYRNLPLSEGLGYLQDRYFLTTALAVGVRERLATLKEMLAEELSRRTEPKVLDIACGSCREIFELAAEIERSQAAVTCVDLDQEALLFSVKRLSFSPAASRVKTMSYNALRMVNHERNLKEFGPQDIIYSVGLFDYLADDVLTRLFPALYRLLLPGGRLIIAFKDRYRYQSCDYQWLVDWAHFLQRSEKDCRRIIQDSGIPADYVALRREGSGVIMFFTAMKI